MIFLKGIVVALLTLGVLFIFTLAFVTLIAIVLLPFRVKGQRIWSFSERGESLLPNPVQ